MNRIKKKKKKLIKNNVTYKKQKNTKIKKERKRTWLIVIRNFDIYIYIYIYFLNVINVEIIKLMEIYTVFWNR